MADWPPIDRDDLKAAATRAGFDTDFPLLVRRLIAETGNGITALDIPGGSGTAAGGFDGVVTASGRTIEVPAGTSVWELSVTDKAQRKADDDYGKRLAGPGGLPTSDVTYVEAILAPWTKSRTWAAARSREDRWKQVLSLNLDRLHSWLDRAPATTAWLAARLGKAMKGVHLIDQWWNDTWLPSTRLGLGARIVLAGREQQARAFVGLLATGRPFITLGGDLGGDALRAFVAAALHADDEPRGSILRSRAVHVADEHSLSQLVRRTQSLVIVLADASLAAELPAQHAHQLVVVGPPGADSDVEVPPVDGQATEAQLRTAGETWERAADLGRLARRSLPALRRALALNPAASTPSWANAPDRLRRRLLLVGAWDGDSDFDRDAVGRCSGTAYDEVQEAALALASGSETPMLGHVDERWYLTSAEDAWLLLSPYLTRDDLTAYQETALEVLGDRDPLTGLSGNELLTAQVGGTQRRFSGALRGGVAQTLALLGRADRPVPASGRTTGSDQARLVGRRLFDEANADPSYALWASLGDVLSLLAQAAPTSSYEPCGTGCAALPPCTHRCSPTATRTARARVPHPTQRSCGRWRASPGPPSTSTIPSTSWPVWPPSILADGCRTGRPAVLPRFSARGIQTRQRTRHSATALCGACSRTSPRWRASSY